MEFLERDPYVLYRTMHSFVDLKGHAPSSRGSAMAHRIIQQFRDFILRKDYPCVGAQAAMTGKSVAMGIFPSLKKDETVFNICAGLSQYLYTFKNKPSSFLTYVAIFPESKFETEKDFEDGLWKLLGQLAQIDQEYFEWDSSVSSDPNDEKFAFSFGGKAFFLVGMHPKSNRKARRFKYPAIAFNLQEQFEGLRSKGRFNVMRNAIRNRELQFDGSINPMLSNFGEGLQAPQYSGRVVDKDWKCPFKF